LLRCSCLVVVVIVVFATVTVVASFVTQLACVSGEGTESRLGGVVVVCNDMEGPGVESMLSVIGSDDDGVAAAVPRFQLVCDGEKLSWADGSGGEERVTVDQQTGTVRVWESRCGRSEGNRPAKFGRCGAGSNLYVT